MTLMVTESIGGQSTRGALVERNGNVVSYVVSEIRYGLGPWREGSGNVVTTNVFPLYGCSLRIEEVSE